MEGIESFHTYLKNLRHQAGMLAETVVSLSESFEAEADRLNKEDGVQRLKEIQATVVEELELSRRQESTASYGYAKANSLFSLAGLAAKLIVAATTENQRARNFVNQVFDTSAEKKCPFGMVMVCVGQKGLPDDVRVVSISALARESNLTEPETIQELRKRGYLLFSQKAFSCLIDKLVIDVQKACCTCPYPLRR